MSWSLEDKARVNFYVKRVIIIIVCETKLDVIVYRVSLVSRLYVQLIYFRNMSNAAPNVWYAIISHPMVFQI